MYNLKIRLQNGSEISAIHTWASAHAYLEFCVERGDYFSHELEPVYGDNKPWWLTMEGVAAVCGLTPIAK